MLASVGGSVCVLVCECGCASVGGSVLVCECGWLVWEGV